MAAQEELQAGAERNKRPFARTYENLAGAKSFVAKYVVDVPTDPSQCGRFVLSHQIPKLLPLQLVPGPGNGMILAYEDFRGFGSDATGEVMVLLVQLWASFAILGKAGMTSARRTRLDEQLDVHEGLLFWEGLTIENEHLRLLRTESCADASQRS